MHLTYRSLPLFAAAVVLAPAGNHASSLPALQSQVNAVTGSAPRINPQALTMGLRALQKARAAGEIRREDVMILIDYSRASTEPRLWVVDLRANRVLFEEAVAHGRNSGDNYTVRFSNAPNSLMTSLGAFSTADAYYGSNGYSLRLRGLEAGVNDRSMERAIVMHGADYVNPDVTRRLGRLGRSHGCPAVRRAVARQIIDTVRGGALVFSWYPDRQWLRTSAFLR